MQGSFDPKLGTFISPEPMIPDLTKVFAYNRYMYAYGNPLKYTDPSGNFSADDYSRMLDDPGIGGLSKPESWTGTLDEFVQARDQYWAYEADPDLFWLDLSVANGEFTGDAQAANGRHALAYAYSSYVKQEDHILITMSDGPDLWGATMMDLYSPGSLIAAGMSGVATIGSPIWTTSRRYPTSAQNACNHYRNHGADFPEIDNALGYVRMAHEFTNNPPSTAHTKVRTNGDVVVWDPVSDIFGIRSGTGTPRTLFKLDPAIHGLPTNCDYLLVQ